MLQDLSLFIPIVVTIIVGVSIYFQFSFGKNEENLVKNDWIESREKKNQSILKETSSKEPNNDSLSSDNAFSALLDERVKHLQYAQVSNNRRLLRSFWLGIITFFLVEFLIVYAFLFTEKKVSEIQLIIGVLMGLIFGLLLKFYNDAFKRDRYFLDYYKNFDNLFFIMEIIKNEDTPNSLREKLYTVIAEVFKAITTNSQNINDEKKTK
ncbi:MAG: hypothetical protein MI974_01865 [Chitinophagales bacterium]|nr:hypothetical protein [Chitinophagales bacterium]